MGRGRDVTTTVRCPGFWVGMRWDVPADPAVYYRGGMTYLGCNRLVCPECKCAVKHLDRARGKDGLFTNIVAAYDSDDPRSLPWIAAADSYRLYYCRCRWSDVSATATNDSSNAVDAIAPGPAWECAGHPI